MNGKLKECPFCGGEASDKGKSKYPPNHEAWFKDGTRVIETFNVHCIDCGSSSKGMIGSQTKEEAIEKWNTRK